MCGIFGWVAAGREPADLGVVGAACQSLYARGPDSGGYVQQGGVVFAARRLAIIDLATGEQPIVSRCRRIAGMQNGEIYNYRELRRELLGLGHPLRTSGDTEVLVYGYLAWGIEGLLQRLDGMFAFALHDRERGLIHVTRDRFGEKPLFYRHEGGALQFSSQLLTLARLPGCEFAINPAALDAYLALHFVPGEETMLAGIRKLLPAHYLTYDIHRDRLDATRYWRLVPQDQRSDRPRREAAEELAARVRTAVCSRLVSDVPVGAFLSGGIDSSVVVSCMADHVAELKTFSVGFESGTLDESPYARLVARRFGADHHHLAFTLDDFARLTPDVVAAMDEPIGDQAMIPALWLARLAREQVTVVLGGEGADEVFGGYSYYRPRALPEDWRAVAYRALRPFLPPAEEDCLPIAWAESTTRSGYPLLFGEAALGSLMRGRQRFERSAWALDFAAAYRDIHDPLQAACFTDIASWLPDDLLVKYDKMAMAASLEGRCPYLEPSLVEWGLALPAPLKVGDGAAKTLLREAFAAILPPEIARRPKQGFILPLAEYFRADGRELLLDHLSSSVDESLLRNDVLRTLVEQELAAPRPDGRKLFAVLLYKMWLAHAYGLAKFRSLADPQPWLGADQEPSGELRLSA